MKRAVIPGILLGWAALTFGQSTEPAPKFEAADVHVSAKTYPSYMRTSPFHSGRWEIKTATMLDLIRTAYGYDADKILGGPSWLEMDRFDVIAKVPEDSTPETQKQMLQTLLEDRFELKVHKETKPVPTYALTAGKKPLLKEADGRGEPGCRPQSSNAPPAAGSGTIRVAAVSRNGDQTATTFTVGPDGTIQYECRNMTMEEFAANLHGMFGLAQTVGTNPVLDQTGLKGKWNFDLRYSFSLSLVLPGGDTGGRISIFEAVDKQLGLKLEEQQVPTPVMVVDRVEEKPTPNPPGTAEILPPIAPPTEFEVASVKLRDPAAMTGGLRMFGFRIQPGGRVVADGIPLGYLIQRAFNVNSNDQIAGIPSSANSVLLDIVAKTPSGAGPMTAADNEMLAPMLRALLVDRFKMTYHTEDREATGYSLVATKPKMKKADPNSRASCKTASASAAGPGGQMMTCQNVTMAQFAEMLRGRGPDLTLPILDSTGLEGGWDFTVTFSPVAGMVMGGRGGAGAAQAEGDVVSASDPSGGLTLAEAVERQLGLKLEKQKRTMPVVVIDHIEQTPTEN